jgi:hypothetical protein
MERITKSGGVVDKLKDFYGNRYGPYRVFDQKYEKPGLAVSRSLGDGLAHTLGVISEPDIESRVLR